METGSNRDSGNWSGIGVSSRLGKPVGREKYRLPWSKKDRGELVLLANNTQYLDQFSDIRVQRFRAFQGVSGRALAL